MTRHLFREALVNLVQGKGLPGPANEVNLGRSSEQHSLVNPFRPPSMICYLFLAVNALTCCYACLPPSTHICEKPVAKLWPRSSPRDCQKRLPKLLRDVCLYVCQSCDRLLPKLLPTFQPSSNNLLPNSRPVHKLTAIMNISIVLVLWQGGNLGSRAKNFRRQFRQRLRQAQSHFV